MIVHRIPNGDKVIIYVRDINNYFVTKRETNEFEDDELSIDEILSLANENSGDEKRIKVAIESYDGLRNEQKAESLFYTLCMHPVRRCNYCCAYCYATENDCLPQEEISIEMAKKAIDFMLEKWGCNARRYVIDLSGSGEPLIRFEFLKEISDFCEKRQNELNRDIKIMFPSNGALIDDEKKQYLLSRENILIGFSIDGNLAHNIFRRSKNRGNAFELTAKAIDSLKDRHVGLAATVTHINEDVDILYDYLYHRFPNADAISIHVVRDYSDRDISFNKINIKNLLKHYEMLLENVYKKTVLEKEYAYIEKMLIGTDFLGVYLCRVFSRGLLNNKRCDAGVTVLSVDQNGELYACNVMNGDKRYAVGDIISGINIKQREKFKNYNVTLNDYCRKCWASNICTGECFAIATLSTGDMFGVNERMCEFRKGLAEFAIRFASNVYETAPSVYDDILGIIHRRSFFEQVLDRGTWALREYLKLTHNTSVASKAVSEMQVTSFGVAPSEILRVLKGIEPSIDAFVITDSSLSCINVPAIACINKIEQWFYDYAIVISIENHRVAVKKPFKEEIEIYEKDIFLEYISDTFIFRSY